VAVEWVIQADDLTGAADTAVGFAAAGLPTVVLPWREGVLEQVPEAAVVAFDTASRDVAAPERAGAVAEWCDSGAWFYKKVDSTLRGNVAAELAAVEGALRPSRVVVAPAFPALGRTTVDGVQRWEGGEVDVAALLGRVVVDAERTEDLDALARELDGSSPRPLLVGSGGLAAAFARRRGSSPAPTPAGTGPVLVVSGSRTELARRQLERLRSLSGDHVLLTGPLEDAPDVAGSLARAAASALRAAPPRLVVVVGGETAHVLCRELGITELWAVGEAGPGAPLLRCTLPGGRELRLVLKSGSFGDDDALARIVAGT
jgi:D-threonate/D-erythronate kinase